MRNRLEDLGRIAEILSQIMESPVLDHGYVNLLEKENFAERIEDMSMDLENLSHDLGRAWEIATGQDFLNEEPYKPDIEDESL